MPTAATMLALCAFSVSSFGPARPPTLITLSSRPQSACAVTEFFHNAHVYFTIQIRMRSHEIFHNAYAYFTVAWIWPAFMIHARGCTRRD